MQDQLNPKLWLSNRLNPVVRERLLIIGQRFTDSLKIDQQPADIIFTGSLASYNWTDASDLDLHVVLDFEAIAGEGSLVKNFMLAKKSLWNAQHKITIKGFPVELYAQDVREPHYASGIYSVLNDQWVKIPTADQPVVDDQLVTKKAEYLAFEIDQAVATQDPLKLQELSDQLRDLRSSGLAAEGEYSVGNQVFKRLRRQGYLGKLSDARLEIADNIMSLSKRNTMTTTLMSDAELLNFCGVRADRIPAKVTPDLSMNRNAQSDTSPVVDLTGLIASPKVETSTPQLEQEFIMVSKKTAGDFRNYCRTLTDAQVLNVVEKERAGAETDESREQDYQDAREEAISRGLMASKKTADYQGWKNYESWAVGLHLDNDEGTQLMLREWITDLKAQKSEQEAEGIWSADEALRFNLADQIKAYIEDAVPELDGLYNDLLHAALSEVDWAEVADHFIDKSKEITGSVTTAAPRKKQVSNPTTPVEVEDTDRKEVGRLIKEGYTSGTLTHGSGRRGSWELKIEMFEDSAPDETTLEHIADSLVSGLSSGQIFQTKENGEDEQGWFDVTINMWKE